MGIWPLDKDAMVNKMAPLEVFVHNEMEVDVRIEGWRTSLCEIMK